MPYRAHKMAQRVKVPVVKVDDLNLIPMNQMVEERTYSPKLSSHLHVCPVCGMSESSKWLERWLCS